MEKVALEELMDLATFTQTKSLLLSRASLLEVINPVEACILRVEWNMSFYSALLNFTETNSWRLKIANILL